ncbi:hypothetical protein [Nonomuraea sp. C10]|uniref:phosphorylase family protein n=1 Tax=Nonomuraea sp. C10 TaxID=2600577 RepID=UPI0011CD7ECD|nr:hypothetical protein [Nonomuraea sp. C10]TXK33946.1 hypothetical protein FR742_31500 [Nonomuraea sp. C10]
MTVLLICTALGMEARAVRRGLSRSPVRVRLRRTGLGPRRAARVAATLPEFDALAVTGFAGSLVPGLRAGDVLVAQEIRYGDRVLACPSAPLLAGELARAGLRARTGSLLTVDHVVTGARGRELAERGAHAVDMETGPLARAAAGRPVAAVRVVVDTPAAPLLSPATLRNALTARRVLRRVGPALTRWAAATAPRTVLRASPDLDSAASRADLVLVIGPAGSPETRHLVESATRHAPARLVETPEHIELAWLRGARTVVLTAGASTSPSLVDTAENALRGLGPVTTDESITFTLPKDAQP